MKGATEAAALNATSISCEQLCAPPARALLHRRAA